MQPRIVVLLGDGHGAFARPGRFQRGVGLPHYRGVTSTATARRTWPWPTGHEHRGDAVEDGNGVLRAATMFACGGTTHGRRRRGDFNGDGKPDLAVGNPDSVAVLLGNGTD